MDILKLISEAHKLYPELRLGQLVTCAAAKSGWKRNDVFYLPDNQLAGGLQSMIDMRKKSEWEWS